MTFSYGGKPSGNPDFDRPIAAFSEAEESQWQSAYQAYVRGQVEELLTRYGQIDLLWFDGGPEAISFARLRELQPGLVVNPRMHGYGDFETAECEFPRERKSGWWEMCSIWQLGGWGYDRHEQYKSTAWMLEEFSRVRSWGGNYLINVGPRPNGQLPEVVYDRLKELGQWMNMHSESVFGTSGYGWPEESNVPATRKGNTVYLFAAPQVKDPIKVSVPGAAETAVLLSDRQPLSFEQEARKLTLTIPASRRGKLMDVVAVTIKP